jgi:hypothetical protein
MDWVAFLSFIGGFVSAIFAEPLRRWLFQSVLTLDFEKTDHFVTSTEETEKRFDPESGTVIETQKRKARYVRVRVTNTSGSLAKNCRAYLVNIEQLGHSGQWEATVYCESMQLAWSGRGDGAYTAVDLPKNVPHFIDVVSMREKSATFQLEIKVLLKRYEAMLSTPGQYRFTILVSGENVTLKKLRLSLKWAGAWDDSEVDIERTS